MFHLLAFACLAWGFAANDFSVLYVATNSSALLPLHYRLAGGVGGGGAHEGSLLLWSLILSGWTLAVAAKSRSLPPEVSARVLAVLGFIAAGFLCFMLFTSNPFARLLPAALAGRDLNPLLQDIGLIVHPPILYMGYVGLAVPFAFAVAALAEGRVDAAWTRWTRPWTTVAWTFLTLGIAGGSWWAYYELGWGGWWFWDPVENASFIPWLVATALIHSLAVAEKCDTFKAWTVLLAIFGFSLSLLGTFIVRSGVLVSVHAFASDPARGVFILAFLALVVGGALALYAWRAGRVTGAGRFAILSRETMLLANNVLLTAAAAAVLLGTLYPLLLDSLGLGQISVGRPYFDRVFVPLMVPLAGVLAFGMLARWKRDRAARLARLLAAAFVAAAAGAAAAALFVHSAAAALGAGLALWIACSTLRAVAERVRRPRDLLRLPRGFLGMSLAHVGFAASLAGVCFVTVLEVEEVVRLAPGESATVSGHEFRFRGVRDVAGPNYRAVRGENRGHPGGASGRPPRPREAHLLQSVAADDGGRDRPRPHPRPLRRPRRAARRRGVVRSAALQAVRALDLARGDPHGLRRRPRRDGPALPAPGDSRRQRGSTSRPPRQGLHRTRPGAHLRGTTRKEAVSFRDVNWKACKIHPPTARARTSASASRSGQHLLVDAIGGLGHAERGVGPLRGEILALDVEPDPDHLAGRPGPLANEPVQGAIDAATSKVGPHVHALDPPQPAVPPIAPLEGDKEGARDLAS